MAKTPAKKTTTRKSTTAKTSAKKMTTKKSSTKATSAKFKKGQVVVAKYEEEWYDGKIISVSKDGKRYSVDIGSEEEFKVVLPEKDILTQEEWDTKFGNAEEEQSEEITTLEGDLDEDFNIDDLIDDDLDETLDDGTEGEPEDEKVVEEAEVLDESTIDDDLDSSLDEAGELTEGLDDDLSEKLDSEDKGIKTDSWFAFGDDEDDEFDDSDFSKQTYRFWLPKGEKRMVTFLTKKPLTLREHQFKKGGSFRNWATCIAPAGEGCPLCESGNRARIVKAFYVIDHTTYENKQGETVKNPIRLMVMTKPSYERLREVVKEYFDDGEISYRGLQIVVKRTSGDQSPNTGDVFIIKKKVAIPKGSDYAAKTDDDLKAEFAPLSRSKLSKKVRFIDVDSEE